MRFVVVGLFLLSCVMAVPASMAWTITPSRLDSPRSLLSSRTTLLPTFQQQNTRIPRENQEGGMQQQQHRPLSALKMAALEYNAERIRNFSIIAHIDHGR